MIDGNLPRRTRVSIAEPKTFQKLDFSGWLTGHYTLPTNSFDMTSGSSPMPLNTDIDDGNAWVMTKNWTDYSFAKIATNNWRGDLAPGGATSGSYVALPQPAWKTDNQLILDGSTMIARTLPNDPAADFSVTAAEIKREGFPTLIGLQTLKNRTQVARNAGSEYLNIEFGWKPLVSGLRDLAVAVKDHEKIWNDYRKGSGRKTRVGFHLDDEKATKVYSGGISPIPSDYPRFLQGTISETSVRKTWFNGAFRYYVPEPVGYSDKMSYWSSQASKILGLRLDPEVVWNLAPWSWAVDWFVSYGDILHNVSLLGKDGLVLQYGYAMSESSRYVDREARDTSVAKSWCKAALRVRFCKRIPANPYGFGVADSSLSAKQIAVIGALGLSRT